MQRLNLQLLVGTKHDSMLGQRDVKADAVAGLGNEVRIVDNLKVSTRCGCRLKARQIR